MEGTKYFRLRVEIELAERVLAELVPPLYLTAGDLEICGRSMPSSTIGGDLVDGRGEEFGPKRLESVILRNAMEPLPQIIERLSDEATRFGGRNEDQTILLVRLVTPTVIA